MASAGSRSPAFPDLVRRLPPSSFAFVMSSGIVSTALSMTGFERESAALLVVAVAGFLILAVLTAIQTIRQPSVVVRNAMDPKLAFGYLTTVAAINVIAARVGADGHRTTTLVLFTAGAALWTALSYGVPAVLMLRTATAPRASGINGTWFLWVVATQSVSVVASSLAQGDLAYWAFIAVALWSVGVILYIILAALLLLRLLTVPSDPESLGPSYWVSAGATAISVLAGSKILELDHMLPVVAATGSFLSGASFALWAFGTWWIPMLVIFGFWRHGLRGHRLGYEAGLWSMVFPVGMYSAASMSLGDTQHLRLLRDVGRAGTAASAVLWLAVAGMAAFAALRWLRPPER